MSKRKHINDQTRNNIVLMKQKGLSTVEVCQILCCGEETVDRVVRIFKAAQEKDFSLLEKYDKTNHAAVSWALARCGVALPSCEEFPAINETFSVDESDECNSEICFNDVPTLSEIKELLDNIAVLLENIIKL